jgi:superfamily II DNA/RNA helicase
MVEGNRGINNDIISRLHGIMRPFLLRRLKKDVAKQLPPKFEHVVMCKLSKRQALLYEEFMARSSTRALMTGGNYMGMMNILMQLRKVSHLFLSSHLSLLSPFPFPPHDLLLQVCNHPDLFEPRPIISPFRIDDISFRVSPLLLTAYSNSTKGSYLNSEELNKWCFEMDHHAREQLKRLAYKDVSFVTIDDLNISELPPNLLQNKYQGYLHLFKSTIMTVINSRRQRNSLLSIHRCDVLLFALSLSWRMIKSCTMPPTIVESAFLSRTNPQIAKWTPQCWSHLLRTTPEWSHLLHDLIIRFVFVLPKVISNGPQLVASRFQTNTIHAKIQRSLNTLESPERKLFQKFLGNFHSASIRQRLFFPDRKLVQYDSGKLQTLCNLLRDLKRGDHKCLIFTQMSKMLDILEIFLNLNGHTYVRLDGSTGIERRQKLMDRFNNDPKIFCFILSTRSGGLGINLTGADTVIFYDSDWNPAMDAQAQDRAHRIGQTREVNIYRLVCKSTVEENILTKAKQKRHLDFLVMSEGEFNVGSLFTTNNLIELLGDEETQSRKEGSSSQLQQHQAIGSSSQTDQENSSSVDIEAAMAAVEDEDDVSALKGAKAEAAQEQLEFDENAVVVPNEEEGNDSARVGIVSQQKVSSSSSSPREDDMEAEFARWQESVGGKDFRTLEAALKPVERYALKIRTTVDPYYSLHYLSDQQKMAEIQAEEQGQEWDIETLEQEKEEEEYRALADGELLAVNLTEEELFQIKSEYAQEKSRRQKLRKLRQLTGEGWSHIIDEVTGIPFWYNEDTGEASYGQPDVIKKQQTLKAAMTRKWNAFPVHLILIVLSYLDPYPDRVRCSYISDRWRRAASDPCFFKRVLSIESGANENLMALEENSFTSLSAALRSALPGETIALATGHHIEDTLSLDIPVRLLGSEDDSSKVMVELMNGIEVSEKAGKATFIGITFSRVRRSTISTSLLSLKNSIINVSPPPLPSLLLSQLPLCSPLSR